MIGVESSSTTKMLAELKNTTSNEGLFEYLDISYYGNTGFNLRTIVHDLHIHIEDELKLRIQAFKRTLPSSLGYLN